MSTESAEKKKKCYEKIENVHRNNPTVKEARELGFGKKGPERNSTASAGQSHLKNVEKGSPHGDMTRIGMKGEEENEIDWELGFGKREPERNFTASAGQSHLKNVAKGSPHGDMTRLGMTGKEENEIDWLTIGLGVAALSLAGIAGFRAYNNNRRNNN